MEQTVKVFHSPIKWYRPAKDCENGPRTNVDMNRTETIETIYKNSEEQFWWFVKPSNLLTKWNMEHESKTVRAKNQIAVYTERFRNGPQMSAQE